MSTGSRTTTRASASTGPPRCADGPAEPETGRLPVQLAPGELLPSFGTPEWQAFVDRFDRAEYRAAVDPLELLYFRRRNTFHQGLLQLTVAHLQLRRGMVRGPRRLLRSARALLAPHSGDGLPLDVPALLRGIDAWLAVLPEGVVETAPEALVALGAPCPRLSREGPPAPGPRSCPSS